MSMSEAAVVDAANATGAEAPPPVAETPWGSSLLEYGLDDAVTDAPPLPTDAAAGEEKKADVAASEQGEAKAPEGEKQEAAPDPAKAEPAKEAVEAKAEDDPELTAEENELVRSRPEVEQPILKDRLKKASFIGQYKDPDVPAKGTVEALRKISPSSFARVETEIIDQRLAEPVPFLDELFERNPELYGTVMLEGYKADPAYFIKQITGKADVAAETVKAALDFYEHNKDRVASVPAGEELTAEELEQAKLYLGEETAKKIEARQKALAPQADPEEVAKLRTELAETQAKLAENGKPKTKEQQDAEAKVQQEAAAKEQAIQVERDETWDAASGQIESYLGNWADDPKDGLGLKVTPQERELAPDVADLKDFKRSVLFEGLGDLPDFRAGFTEWGKTREPFTKALKQTFHFANLREKDNAMEAARNVIPFVDQYKQERLKAPIFARIDNLIRIATAKANPKTVSDAIIPGAVGASSPQPTSDPGGRIVDLLFNDAVGAGK